MEWEFNSYYTLIAATLVLLVGKFLVQKIKFLRDFNIPEPVAGGLVAAIVLFALHEAYGVSFKFEKPLQDAFMLIFFTSIGLSADFSRLKAGGLPWLSLPPWWVHSSSSKTSSVSAWRAHWAWIR